MAVLRWVDALGRRLTSSALLGMIRGGRPRQPGNGPLRSATPSLWLLRRSGRRRHADVVAGAVLARRPAPQQQRAEQRGPDPRQQGKPGRREGGNAVGSRADARLRRVQ